MGKEVHWYIRDKATTPCGVPYVETLGSRSWFNITCQACSCLRVVTFERSDLTGFYQGWVADDPGRIAP